MKKKRIYTALRYGAVLLLGLFFGKIFFRTEHTDNHPETTVTAHSETWTCSMHPQIKTHHPGKCPICGMDLIPLHTGGNTAAPDVLHLSPDALQLAGVETSVVSRQSTRKTLHLYGKIQTDERLLSNQVAQINGRIDKLGINFTGEAVHKGQLLAVIYSPELIAAQQELLEAAALKTTQPDIYRAAREKLRGWMLTDAQIDRIVNSGKTKTSVEVYANTSGVVISRRVSTGDYVQQGYVLFEIASLSSVWVEFDAYESDLPFLRKGDPVQFSTRSLPGKQFSARIRFIDPVMDAVNRVSKVRVEVPNANGALKPGMFVNGTVEGQTEKAGNKIVIPRSAILWTGKRSVVWIKVDEGAFRLREITTGPSLGSSYVVLNGLEEGDEIVTEGAFQVDAAAQLEGKKSMMEH